MGSTENKPKILIVDDEQSVLNSLNRTLRHEFDVLLSLSGDSALQLMRENEISVILADQRMPNMTGVEFLQKAHDIQPDTERILITGYSDISAVIEAINLCNIFYYIHKPWEPESLRVIVRRASQHYCLIQENRSMMRELKQSNLTLKNENEIYNEELRKQYRFDQIVGKSTAIQHVFKLMRKVIPTNVTVLLQGETGTGKELIARAIHFNSPRKNKPFIAQNCAALPDTLLESALFGHKKGAFTDAASDKKGLFELANNGTIFLDEVAEMSPAMQQRLLRVLQEKEIQALGSEKTKTVDVRVISATNKNLSEEVKKGRFREDLYYRLNVFPICVPSLNKRRDDIPLLVEHFINKLSHRIGKTVSEVSSSDLSLLVNKDYPGNIRELENIIERSIVLAENDKTLTIDVDRESFSSRTIQTDIGTTPLKELTENIEKHYIKRTLSICSYNIQKTAKALGISRSGLYIKMDRYGIKEGFSKE